MTTRMPKQIWQTYKSADLPMPAVSCVRSWRRLNQGWKYRLLDDREIDAYVRARSTGEEYVAFSKLPLGVMKADFWRYFVLLNEGGIYSDIDTVANNPAEYWTGDGTALVVGVEDTREFFCQWTIAAPPNHPVLRIAIDLIVDRVHHDLDYRSKGVVHHLTGPKLWTDAIRQYLTFEGGPDVSTSQAERIQLDSELWAQREMLIHPWNVLCGGAVSHLFASKRWLDLPGYDSWRMLGNGPDLTRAIS